MAKDLPKTLSSIMAIVWGHGDEYRGGCPLEVQTSIATTWLQNAWIRGLRGVKDPSIFAEPVDHEVRAITSVAIGVAESSRMSYLIIS